MGFNNQTVVDKISQDMLQLIHIGTNFHQWIIWHKILGLVMIVLGLMGWIVVCVSDDIFSKDTNQFFSSKLDFLQFHYDDNHVTYGNQLLLRNLGFSVPSVTVVVVDNVSAPAGPEEHAKDGNLWKRAARYLG